MCTHYSMLPKQTTNISSIYTVALPVPSRILFGASPTCAATHPDFAHCPRIDKARIVAARGGRNMNTT